LALAALTLATCLRLAGGTAADGSPQADGAFRRLPEYASRNGALNVTLVAAPKSVMIDGVRFDALAFNGEYAGPVLRLKPGDRLKIHLVNRTAQPINLHFHGSYASPKAAADNIRIEVAPGTEFDYRLTVPLNQPPGLYWYHTHIHGLAENEVNRGLSGAMIIAGVERRVPETASVRARLLVLKTFTLENTHDPAAARLHGIIQSINGSAYSAIRVEAGKPEFWRISNQSPNDYYHLSIKGVRFRVVATDGAPTVQDMTSDTLNVAPAGRTEAMVTFPAAGDYQLLSGSTPTGTGRSLKVTRELALITAEPAQPEATGRAPAPADAGDLVGARLGAPPIDLRQSTIAAHRSVVFSQAPGQEIYLINGRTFDHNRIDASVPLGSVEEWTIRNDTDDMHVFHIHQLHFQVVAINGQPQPFVDKLDTVRVPERGEVTIRIPFTDPQIVGHFVYHCHVLKHEDKGMMANIEVYDPKIGPDRLDSPDFNYRGQRPWWLRWLGGAQTIGGYICHSPAPKRQSTG